MCCSPYSGINTSDHIPIRIGLNLGDIPRGCIDGPKMSKVRWDKMWDGPRVRTPSIKNSAGKVDHNIDDILLVWKEHFTKLGTLTVSPNFDEQHHEHVMENVHGWLLSNDIDEFTENPFTCEKIRNGIKTLNGGKTPGYDGVTKEHLKNADPVMIDILCLMYNRIRRSEYIPVNFRRGIQIPLYKGRNSSIVEVNNYRGITLLTTFNKLFEILIWKRLEEWWVGAEVLSRLQGACRQGVSCLHSALLLQETISP